MAEHVAYNTASWAAQWDRTGSPAEVSRKRELFNEWPETFGIFGWLLRKLGVWRPPAELQKPATSGLFCDWLRSNLGPSDCLAGAGGFEPPHGGIKIPCLTTWRRPN
jgi:hypothetical protein